MGIDYTGARLPFVAYAPEGFYQQVYQRIGEDNLFDGVVVNGWRHEEGDGKVLVAQVNCVTCEDDFIAAESMEALLAFVQDWSLDITPDIVGHNVSIVQIRRAQGG